MDLFTHALLGAKLAHVAAPARPCLTTRERLLLAAVAAAFPDIDFACFLIDPLVFLADWHQGPTHSVLLLPLWAALIAILFAGWVKRRNVLSEAVLVSGLGLASHIAADLLTVYGTMVLYPLSRRRMSLGTTFVIDPVFTGIVLAGLAGSLWSGHRRVAAAGLVLLAGYVAAQMGLQQRALEVARVSLRASGLEATRLSALPQPFSPFNWKLIASDETLHRQAYVNLVGHPPLLPSMPGLQRLHDIAAAFQPPQGLDWHVRHRHGSRPELQPAIRQLWDDPRFAPFRRFATHPSVSGVEQGGGETCVWFTDLRYDLPALPDTFRYGFCRDGTRGPWRLYRLRYFSAQDRQRLG
ncbi:metal-dependent hydrolase [Caldimonas tepidiphila]|uniref:metal-dependent hydrolase n=1 Tax=Caldimonas tepidiphila TaxID=2315841 RepID=UPI000E5C4B8D|nr:metal-dependent hydrolase [Caldimonas tepidiphila]